MYKIHLLPAAYGDSILIEYGKTKSRYILIDGGPYYNFKVMADGLKRVTPKLKELELLVITHIDIDHIDGIVTLLKEEKIPFKIKDVWFNGYDQIKGYDNILGALQGEYISTLIRDKKLPHNKSFKGKSVVVNNHNNLPIIKLTDGMNITLLCPSKIALTKLIAEWNKQLKKYGKTKDFAKKMEEDKRYDNDDDILGHSVSDWQKAKVTPDKAAPNGSSIAFIGRFEGKSCLFAGDATTDYLMEAIDPILKKNNQDHLTLDAWKLSHHGSKKSTLEKLMKKINCKKILISTNGAKFGHPNPESISKLLMHNGPNLQLYFNYKTEFTEIWDNAKWQKDYKYKSFFPSAKNKVGITIKL